MIISRLGRENSTTASLHPLLAPQRKCRTLKQAFFQLLLPLPTLLLLLQAHRLWTVLLLQLESSSCVVLLCFNRCIVISLAGNAHFAHLPLPPLLLLLLQLHLLLLLLCCCGCNCKNSGCCCSECCCGVVGDAVAVVVVVVVAVCGNEHTQHIA